MDGFWNQVSIQTRVFSISGWLCFSFSDHSVWSSNSPGNKICNFGESEGLFSILLFSTGSLRLSSTAGSLLFVGRSGERGGLLGALEDEVFVSNFEPKTGNKKIVVQQSYKHNFIGLNINVF